MEKHFFILVCCVLSLSFAAFLFFLQDLQSSLPSPEAIQSLDEVKLQVSPNEVMVGVNSGRRGLEMNKVLIPLYRVPFLRVILWWRSDEYQQDAPPNSPFFEIRPALKATNDHNKAFWMFFEMLEIAGPEVKWFVGIDADTWLFVPSLLRLLGKYEPKKKLYIGNWSESLQQVNSFGYYAYGGGGIVLSRATLEQLKPFFDKCATKNTYGDKLLYECIHEHLNLELTREKSFHQMDIDGDLRGFIEGAAAKDGFVTLHHVKTELNPTLFYRMYNELAGAFLKTYSLYDQETNSTLVLTYGYSIRIYKTIIKPEELVKTEKTFNFWNGNHGVNDFPLRPFEKDAIVYLISDGTSDIQFYVDKLNRDVIKVKCGTCYDKQEICLSYKKITVSGVC